ncbi:MAG: cytochrome P450 [Candidatus Binatia bacterium]
MIEASRDAVEDRSLLAPEIVQDPHPYFHELRARDPVHWSEIHRGWLLTRHDDVGAAFRDLRLSSSRVSSLLPFERSEEERASFEPIWRSLANWMVFKDPPEHAHLRRLARAAFAVRTVESLRPMITRVVDELLDRLEAAGRADFVATFAYPLASTVIANGIGVPAADQQEFRAWSEDVATFIFGSGRADRRELGVSGVANLERYFRELLDRARRENAPTLLGDLARVEETGETLSDDEVVATCAFLLFAGHETTANLVSSSILALDRFPAERERLRREPRLIPSAVEEALRFEGPAKLMVRIAMADVEMRGRTIRSGQRVFLVQAAANRDPERFADPDRFDAAREDNDHYGFGYGIHHCLGAPLARLESQIALSRLLERLPRLRVVEEAPRWRRAILMRNLERLDVATE